MFKKEVYKSRRDRLAKKFESGVLLFLGNSEAFLTDSGNAYKFRNNSSFLYFYGYNEPDMAGVIDVDSGEEIFFGNDVTMDDIIWMGNLPKTQEKAEKVGIAKSEQMSELEDYLRKAKNAGRKIHFLPPYRYQTKMLLNKMLAIPFDEMDAAVSVDLIKAVVSLRLVKEECEIEEIDKACDIGYLMHYTVMRMARLGMSERELYGIMSGVALSHGFYTSFPTILSQNGETLHNHSHHQVLTDGRMMVIDAGVESMTHYASDNTRTLPSSGKFTDRQKDVYQIVVDANNLNHKLARPGVSYTSVHQEISKLIATAMKDLGFLKGEVEDIVANGAHSLFMPHGLGHNMGLDVHDMQDLGEDYVGYDDKYHRSTQFGLNALRMGKLLAPGHVVTDEPGIYFIPALIDKWEAEGINKDFVNFDKLKSYYDFGGIRLEDDILITKDGSRLLGHKRIPITIAEVEETMKH